MSRMGASNQERRVIAGGVFETDQLDAGGRHPRGELSAFAAGRTNRTVDFLDGSYAAHVVRSEKMT